LKVVWLVQMKPEVKTTEEHLIKVLKYFKNDATIMAYDLFNEPLYFDHGDKPPRKKEEVHQIVKQWNKLVKKYAPRQLSTIGLEGIREVFAWDPNILDLDFLSFHPYEYEPEQVRNEIYWYGKYITKPWMLGETSLPADNDSVTYEEQRKFAEKTIKQTVNCGSLGYTWWQYKDVDWKSFHSDFMGVITRQDKTHVERNLSVNGSVKPLVNELKKINIVANNDSCLCLKNYYNYSQGNKCRIIGRLTDENNQPIEGGIILGWNENWSHSYHTITKKDGSFELLGTFPFYHWMASATLYSMIRDDITLDAAQKIHGIPTINIGSLKLKKLLLSE
jgi:hypothetical protein